MKKRLCVIALIVALLATSFALGVHASAPIRLIVNGQEIQPDVPPQIIDGRVMVPVRFVSQALGYEVKWEETTNTVLIYNKKQEHRFYEVKSKTLNIPTRTEAVYIFDGEVYLPIIVFGKYYAGYDNSSVTFDMPSGKITLQKSAEYKPGTEAVNINGRTFVRASALKVKPIIEGNVIWLEALD